MAGCVFGSVSARRCESGVHGAVLGLMGKDDGIASLIRRTLVRTRAPIFRSLRRMVPAEARRNWVWPSRCVPPASPLFAAFATLLVAKSPLFEWAGWARSRG